MLINSNVDALVQYYDQNKNDPMVNIDCAMQILDQIKNGLENPCGTIEDAIALLIVANGDF